jgi:hypothetical protein
MPCRSSRYSRVVNSEFCSPAAHLCAFREFEFGIIIIFCIVVMTSKAMQSYIRPPASSLGTDQEPSTPFNEGRRARAAENGVKRGRWARSSLRKSLARGRSTPIIARLASVGG